ncbi:MAG: glycerophosphodiester phosphodiesterase family protein [Pseudomonadota bacterium]
MTLVRGAATLCPTRRLHLGALAAGAALAALGAAQSTPANGESKVPLIVAHRACSVETSAYEAPARCAENTLAAIRETARLSADMAELDVRVSADGALVLLHDKRLARTTNGRGKVHETTLEHLRTLDAGGGERIPTLEEALALSARLELPVLLDLKTRRVTSDALVRSLSARDPRAPVYVGAHSPERVRELRALEPGLRIVALPMSRARLGAYLDARPDGVRVWARWANKKLVARLRAARVDIWVTLGSRGRAHHARILALGVDAMITDRPVLLDSLREASERSASQHPAPRFPPVQYASLRD